MTTPRDPEADDLFVDRLLAEELGAERGRDLRQRVLGADASQRARAAAAVDAAAATDAGDVVVGEPSRLRRFALRFAAACVVIGFAVVALWPTPAPNVAPASPADRAIALLDAFHRVMPLEPPALRDAERRQRIAPDAVPVLREIVAFTAQYPAVQPLVGRAPEFVILTLVLGDPSTVTEVRAGAASGAAAARLMLATADVIVAVDAATREVALAQVATELAQANDAAPSAVNCLLFAADLSPQEATRLARAAADDQLAQRLRIGAELATNDPRRLLGRPLALTGRLLTGGEFSTALLQGKVVLVFFWASWCQPCWEATTEIAALAERHARDGLAVVGVSCDHDRVALERYLVAHPEVTWPQLFDAGQSGWHQLAFWCGVRTVPRTFLLDRKGVLREIHTRGELERLVVRLLAE